MTLWLIMALMTAGALSAIAWPLAFSRVHPPSDHEIAIYKDQLAEIERDHEAGRIEAPEAKQAQIEVSRRLLEAASASDSRRVSTAVRSVTGSRRFATLMIVFASLPVFAGSIYLKLGSPRMALGERTIEQTSFAPAAATVDALIGQVESKLRDNPKDGRAWEALAPVYLHAGRYQDSARAWQNAIAILGTSADREAGLGESLVAAANGIVTEDAQKAFNKALSLDQNSVIALFYSGLAAKQDARRDEAARIWRKLIAEAPPDADWVDTVRDALAGLDVAEASSTNSSPASDGPTAAMIQSMVDGLAERLKTNGGNPEGWLRLARSYSVLGDRKKSEAAVDDARRALASDPDKLAQFENGLKGSGSLAANVPTESEAKQASTTREQNNETMQTVVDRLSERLRSQGGKPDSWVMLVRSYETLGAPDKAAAATAEARISLSKEPDQLKQFNQLLGEADHPASGAKASARAEPQAPTDLGMNAQQSEMIKGMVDGLADRLKRDSKDVDGWLRLMRSYVVLGQQEKASAAFRSASAALVNDPEGLRRLTMGAGELGLDSK